MSWPVWLIAAGLILVVAAAIGALVSVGFRAGDIARILAPGNQTPAILISVVAALLGIFVFTIGIVTWVAYHSSSRERARQGYASIWTILSLVLVAMMISLVISTPLILAQVQGTPGDKIILTPGDIVISLVSLDGPLIALLYLRIVRPGVLSWLEMGFTTSRFWQRVGVGVLVGCLALVVAGLATEGLRLIGVDSSQMETFAGVRGASLPQFIGVLLAASVIAPVCEETFFRGYIVTATKRQNGVPIAILTSSGLF
ncbi:MAG TPA: CPBP family intramembrane glutamic endopeptidase, partial [Chloroflexota bacterium]|nr:CPBP family intramembrane glutamic endopeptidase [Chloroflexota bacterium]